MQYVDRDKVELILNWCIYKFGKPKYRKRKLKLKVYKSKGTSVLKETGVFGAYYNGTISIYTGHKMSMRFLCGIICHEYKHYLLGNSEWEKHFKKLRIKYYDEETAMINHPHEKICDKFENKWRDICYEELKSLLYKK